MVHYLIYLSTATDLFTDDTLQSILESSRQNNSKKGITGLLLYHDGAILQVLEGDRESVTQLYKLLELDYRHRSVIKVMEGDADTHYFKDWSMGFRRVSSKEWEDIEGYLPVNGTPFSREAEQDDSRQGMLAFLHSFYRTNFSAR